MDIRIKVNDRIYIKDPESSDLGRRIITHSLIMMDEMGFEDFTIRKLAESINSTEASVYRYFENKHKILVYLLSWYWDWLGHQLTMGVFNLEDPKERLHASIRILSHAEQKLPTFTTMDIAALYRIVVTESPKVYLHREVDEENKEGYFLSYKGICGMLAKEVQAINPEYPYANALMSTVIESAHDQKFFSDHLPSLTDVKGGDYQQVAEFLIDLVNRTLR